MTFARSRRFQRGAETWPSFVDVLSNLLLVFIFLLVVFMLSQFFLQQALSGRSEALKELNQQVAELAQMLALERQTNVELRETVAGLSSQLRASASERDTLVISNQTLTEEIEKLKRVKAELEAQVSQMAAALEQKEGELTQLNERFTALRDRTKELEAKLSSEAERTTLAQRELKEEQALSAEQREQIRLLNEQLASLREQLARIEDALEVAKREVESKEVVIADLGKQLNMALAGKVEELARYRSEFFGRLRDILAGRSDIRIVGDRFVFQSDVLFATASADLSDDAKRQLGDIAAALKEISAKIPPEINWILEVGGHTDKRPINTPYFPSNWELSQFRALAVVRYLISQGIPPERLAAAGYGPYQPIDPGDDEIAYRRNRRIELRLTDRGSAKGD